MTRSLLATVVFALTGTACMAGHAASAATPEPAATAPPSAGAAMGGGMAGMCPMSVPGTKVSAADTATGEALTFTTTPDQAAALRERVHAMADMHNRQHASGETGHGGMMGGMMGGGMGGEEMGGMPPPSRAAVEDLPDGARIQVTPNDPADLQKLQSAVRSYAQHMEQQGCGMMDHPQHGS
ncbi:hypothetical protein [Anaeromyxobacter oryzae]|uniref:Uncharacterized protein n=1 Tax=Anaeromyxobacter oryzae TaxID=2918170 RepID=A0ABM7WSD9_9BACT|nr:hypothetical protein [Anaeromyxobacter oryzae]BDG02410.1 hypothetical protein AMOR_14060 [Anaeromyxobacter oryzae]